MDGEAVLVVRCVLNCSVHYEALKTLVAASEGFEFLAEGGKKKKGFVGLKPGVHAMFHPLHPSTHPCLLDCSVSALRPLCDLQCQYVAQLQAKRSRKETGRKHR